MGPKEPKCREKEEEDEPWKSSHPVLAAQIILFLLLEKVGKLQNSSVIFCYYWTQNNLLFLGANLPYSCSYHRDVSIFSILNNFWCIDQAAF